MWTEAVRPRPVGRDERGALGYLRVVHVGLVTALVFAASAGCAGDPAAHDDLTTAADTSAEEVASDVAATRCEAGAGGCVLRDDETCAACFSRLATCCYGDADIQGMITPLTAACEERLECRRCCDECAADTCESLRAYTCPAVLVAP
jgi:hypothetical protein